MSSHRLSDVLQRLKQVTGAKTDSDLAKALKISPQTLSSWKVRDSIPYSMCVELAIDQALSLDWLLLGNGEGQPSSTNSSTTASEQILLEQWRSLSCNDRQAIHAHLQDRLRIQQLEKQLGELSSRLPLG